MLSMKLLICSLLVIIGAVAQENEESESRLVYTAQGPVRGYKDSDSDVFAFYNIPYAEAPTGRNKFKAPLPPRNWSRPLEAVNRNIICPQFETLAPNVYGTIQEDCLVANVYVPNTKDQNLPVAVYFHGGGFSIGSGNSIKPMTLVRESNIIVVTFNYRLGIHGFLCLGTEDAPGNAGMKDQVALLRWVKTNIGKFGGNAHGVTLVGCSAGSASIDLLMLSKFTHGLFGKVILASGSSTSPFALQVDPLKTAKEYAKFLNFSNVDDIFALGEFYKTIPLESLKVDQYMDEKNSGVVFGPCVEQNIGVEMFLDEAPIYTLSQGKYRRLPVMYGFTDMEGFIRFPNFDDWKDGMNETFSDFLPINLQFSSEDERESVAQTIKEFYFGDHLISENNIQSYIDYFTDVLFAFPMLSTVKYHVNNGHQNVYLYEYAFVDDDNWLVPFANLTGAEHCAQEVAVLDENGIGDFNKEDISENYKNMKEVMRELWSNFIKTGVPTPENSSLPTWLPVGTDRSPHMSLGSTVELRGTLLEERANFWEEIYAKYYHVPQPPMPAPV